MLFVTSETVLLMNILLIYLFFWLFAVYIKTLDISDVIYLLSS